MSYKYTTVAYNSSWNQSGVGYYTRQEYVPPPTPQQKPHVVSYGTSSSSSGGGSSGGGGADCTCEGFWATIYGLLCTASIVFMVLIPNYPKSIPIGFVAIPATVFGILFLMAVWFICRRNC